MPEEVAKSIEVLQEALKKLPKEAAEKLAAEAANRAEAVADYVEMANSVKPEEK